MPPSTSTSSSACCSSSTSPTSFESRRDELQAELTKDGIKGEQLERLLEIRDEYTAERVFWVPPESRWPNLQNQATRPDIATLIDDAILAVERDNPNLKGKLPRDYARRGIEPVKMAGLINLIADIGFKGDRGKARDTLGRVYEYFLGKFAAAEGKLGGEFYTPRSVVRVLVEMLEPYAGRVYDPACGSGGMFVQSEKFVEAHGGNTTDVSIFGQESNPTTWRLAHMNLAIHGIEANLGAAARRHLPPRRRTPTSRPTSSSPIRRSTSATGPASCSAATAAGPSATRPSATPTTPGSSTSSTTSPTPTARGGGMAGFVMANGSLSSNTGGEGDIRRKIVEADLVDCIVALPAQLFFTTGIPVCLWFLTRDKTGKNIRTRHAATAPAAARAKRSSSTPASSAPTADPRAAASLSRHRGDAECVPPARGDPLPTSPTSAASSTPTASGAASPPRLVERRRSTASGRSRRPPASAKPATIDEIAKHGHVLTPGRYVGAEDAKTTPKPFAEKYPRMVAELEEYLAEGERLATARARAIGGSRRCRMIGRLTNCESLGRPTERRQLRPRAGRLRAPCLASKGLRGSRPIVR